MKTGDEAKKLFHDSQNMLQMISANQLIQAHGVVAIYPAFSEGDDIKVTNEDKSDVIATLHGLRQQVRVYVYMCML